MKAIFGILFIVLTSIQINAQRALSIKQIMQGPKFVGTSPSRVYWGEHGEYLYFNWNPDQAPSDSLYRISITNNVPEKVRWNVAKNLPSNRGEYNASKTQKLYTKSGDLFLYDLNTRKERQITNTLGNEGSPWFSVDGSKIMYQMSGNLFAWSIADGSTVQLTNFKSGKDKKDKKASDQDDWIGKEQMELIDVLNERKVKNTARKEMRESRDPDRPKVIYTGKSNVGSIYQSHDGQFITYSLSERAQNTRTKVPDYVTESGYVEDLNGRPKVGAPSSVMTVGIYDVKNDTTYMVQTDELPGLDKVPDFVEDKDRKREVFVQAPVWSPDGSRAMVIVRSKDNKDRWITQLDLTTGMLKTLDHQHDEAWIAGPGIGWSQWDRTNGWFADSKTIWFQSEATGYSHLYMLDFNSGKKKAVTKGKFEIYSPRLSNDENSWYFESNKRHSGERHVYQMSVNGGKMTQLTTPLGRSEGYLSPDESKMAILHSTANSPTELYLADNIAENRPKQITKSTTEEFNTYKWRTPDYVTFKAKDGAEVNARLYKPASGEQNGPAVIFVHGAGYLQNAHKWWSSYYREYMFHNMLVDQGYTVLDIDYRGSAGYGRDWRTGIYQHMGGLDLNDQIDGAKYLVDNHGIDSKRLGIYGGSYGGFITLMAMFNQPDVFAAGAALRSVTDWAHYNHGYTSNILNTPVDDPEAFRKSSPIYFAEGLKGALLICHGMIDTNVQFQDVVRLSQRLIELGKDNWELAVYPLEAHGFVEPSSWTDEYSRIFKLFEDNLK
jgi:dipeptidyl aminopeptidase/acylaminoacyl peptidase